LFNERLRIKYTTDFVFQNVILFLREFLTNEGVGYKQ